MRRGQAVQHRACTTLPSAIQQAPVFTFLAGWLAGWQGGQAGQTGRQRRQAGRRQGQEAGREGGTCMRAGRQAVLTSSSGLSLRGLVLTCGD